MFVQKVQSIFWTQSYLRLHAEQYCQILKLVCHQKSQQILQDSTKLHHLFKILQILFV